VWVKGIGFFWDTQFSKLFCHLKYIPNWLLVR
jgi:hypothetical protein